MDADVLPVYERPKAEFLQVLGMLQSCGGSATKSRLIEALEETGAIASTAGGADLIVPAKHGQLRTLLDPMERDWQLVSDLKGATAWCQ